MNVGIMVMDLIVSGGAQRQAIELARCLKKNGHSVTMYALYYDGERCYPHLTKDLNIKFISKGAEEKGWPLKLHHRNKMMRRLVDMVDPGTDVLNMHLLPHPAATYFRSRFDIPVVAMVNDVPLPTHSATGKSWPKRKMISMMTRINYGLYKKEFGTMDRLVVLDRRDQGWLLRHYGKESRVIHSGLNLDEFKFVARERNRKLKILTAGIFFPHRRLEDVVQSVKILKERGVPFEYHHIGSDAMSRDYAETVYRAASEANLGDAVKFHGFVSNEELVRFYASSDVFVFPNSPQSWGLAVFEAMACGTPVICSTGAGAHEVLTNEKDALLVPPKSPESIAANLIRLHEDEGLWKGLHVNGRAFVENHITWEIYAKEMLEEFDKAVKGRGGK